MKVGVPSGVGDVYWALTKLKGLREANGWPHVQLIVQKSHHDRSTQWPEMVNFVNAAWTQPFHSPQAVKTGYEGYHKRIKGPVLWPNAIIDRGEPLASWLPDIPIDQDFEISVVPHKPRVVVFASSFATCRAWLPHADPSYWSELCAYLGSRFGEPPLLIGADWDLDQAQKIKNCELRIGGMTLKECAGVLKHARVVVGLICGMTILANHFRTPTISLAPDHFPKDFGYNWTPEGAAHLVLRDSKLPTPSELSTVAAWTSLDRPIL